MKAAQITFALVFFTWLGQSPTIPASKARIHDGEQATVCGIAKNEFTANSSCGKPTFIDVDSTYPDQIFRILVWDQDRNNVGTLPPVGSHVCASGVISYFRGVPQIVVKTNQQLSK